MNLLSWQISPLFDPFFSDSVTEAAVVDAAERSDDNRSGATLRKDQVQYPARDTRRLIRERGESDASGRAIGCLLNSINCDHTTPAAPRL